MIVFDTETGGIDDPTNEALLQIGAYNSINGARFNVYITPPPGLTVHPKAAEVNGWPASHADKNPVSEKEAVSRFVTWVQMAAPEWFICHNAPYDMGRLKAAMSRCGIGSGKLPRALCTMDRAHLLNELGGLPVTALSLDKLIKELAPEYVRPQVHDAAEDAYATWLVWEGLKQRFYQLNQLANSAVMSTGGFQQNQPSRQNQQPFRRKGGGR